MDVKVGERWLIYNPNKGTKELEEVMIKEIKEGYIYLAGAYPYWWDVKKIDFVQKLDPPVLKERKYVPMAVDTEGLICPLSKDMCNRKCAWYVEKTCSVLRLMDSLGDIASYVNDDC